MGSNRILVVLSLVVCAVVCSSCGPHMNIQPSIKPYERSMPVMPAGTVPTRGALGSLTLEESKRKTNPLTVNPENLRLGKVYYGYYCLMCHGSQGDGNGPVGQSYVPKPTDFSSAVVQSLSDGDLYLRMLVGVGHDSVMSQTVLPEHRWPIVLYVRQLSRTPRITPTPPMGPPVRAMSGLLELPSPVQKKRAFNALESSRHGSYDRACWLEWDAGIETN
jgi:mono/diheme cytochrome c family protein